MDLVGGVKVRLFDRRLKVDLGYVRVTYPGFPPDWQFGVIASAFGLDMTLAYTDTSIEPVGCGNTNYCAGRVFIALTKMF